MKIITPREKSILDLIGQGLSTNEIALALNISFHTVQSHRRSLLKKFDSKNSVELIRKALKKIGLDSDQSGFDILGDCLNN